MPENSKIDSFDDHCRALGRVCVTWAILDRQLVEFCGRLVGDTHTVASIFGVMENVSMRCEAAKNLLLHKGLDREWRDVAFALLSYIQNDLGKRRNRYIHDEWTANDGQLHRVDRRTRRTKSQEIRDLQLEFITWHPTPTVQVDHLAGEIELAIIVVRCAIGDLWKWGRTGQLPEQPSLYQTADLVGLQDKIPKTR